MKVLITGSTGFIGKHLVASLVEHDLLLVVRNKSKALASFGDIHEIVEEQNPQFEKIILDFAPEYVFHLAGDASPSDELEQVTSLIHSNVLFASRLLAVLSQCNIKLFVNFSTSLLYESNEKKAVNLYAATKSAFSEIVTYYQNKTGFKWMDLVLYNVYGVGDTSKKAINYIIDSLDSKHIVKMSPGLQKLDFIFVDDVVDACHQTLESLYLLKMYTRLHLGTGISISLQDMAKYIEEISGKKCNIEWGGISYRKNEKMVSQAPVLENQFWIAKTGIKEGVKILLNHTGN
jgi:nucleoside-diphosphate-sugar epimerase